MPCSYMWPYNSNYWTQYILIVATGATMIISIPGNIFTGYVIASSQNLRNEPAYILICSVCVADTLLSSMAQPLYITMNLLGGRRNCLIDNIYFVCGWFSSVASTLGIIAITLDRYVYIIYPLHYRQQMTKKRAQCMTGTVWLIATLFATIPLVYHNSLLLSFVTLLTLIVVTVFMAFSYKKVYREIRSNLQKSTKTVKSRREHQATSTVLFIVLAFSVCWYPWTIVSFMIALHNQVSSVGPLQKNATIIKLHWIFLAIGYFNSALNVYIYGRKNTVLREAMRKKLRQNNINISTDIQSSFFHNTCQIHAKTSIESSYKFSNSSNVANFRAEKQPYLSSNQVAKIKAIDQVQHDSSNDSLNSLVSTTTTVLSFSDTSRTSITVVLEQPYL